MDIKGELEDLQRKVLLFATEPDRKKRWAGGRWVEAQCSRLDRIHRIMDGFNDELKVELAAIVTIVFDYCLYDCIEDADWMEAMPDHYDGDMNEVYDTVLLEGLRS